jgi:hypothetical protein
MHKQHKVDGRALIDIFHNKVQPTTQNSRVFPSNPLQKQHQSQQLNHEI